MVFAMILNIIGEKNKIIVLINLYDDVLSVSNISLFINIYLLISG